MVGKMINKRGDETKILFYILSLARLFTLSIIVLLSFSICWLPYLNSLTQILQVLHRLFPFNRGLFEVLNI